MSAKRFLGEEKNFSSTNNFVKGAIELFIEFCERSKLKNCRMLKVILCYSNFGLLSTIKRKLLQKKFVIKSTLWNWYLCKTAKTD